MDNIKSSEELNAIEGYSAEAGNAFRFIREKVSVRGWTRKQLGGAALSGSAVMAGETIAIVEHINSNPDLLTNPKAVVGLGMMAAGLAAGGYLVRAAGRELARLRSFRDDGSETQAENAGAVDSAEALHSYTQQRRFDTN